MRVFLDANILFSAAKNAGALRRFLKEQQGKLVWVADAYVIGEAHRNLEIKYPAALADLREILTIVEAGVATCPALFPGLVPLLPEKDRPVLSSAIHLRCEILLTGDKQHFGNLYGLTIGGVTIHSPQSLAVQIGRSGG